MQDHHHQQAPVSRVAPTAHPQVPPVRSVSTALRAHALLSVARVNDMVSLATEIELSLTVVVLAVASLMILARLARNQKAITGTPDDKES